MARFVTFDDFTKALNNSVKIDMPIYFDGYGFHFYAMLRPTTKIAEAKSKMAMEYAERVLKNYTQAASDASRSYGSECCILEHQGWVIHFYLHTEDRENVVRFAKLLAALVDGKVMESYGDVTLQFHMAAEYGRSILIGVDSSTKEEAAKSCVSLGPCANAPAKKMGEASKKTSRPLWIRMKNEDGWDVEDCEIDKGVIANICDGKLPMEYCSFRTTWMTDERIVAVCRAQPLKEAIEDSQDGYLDAYCFRADMDGFTKAVKRAFESSDKHAVVELVTHFVGYMKAVNNWQDKDPAINMVPYPWAGDCCVMLARPNYGKGFPMENFEVSQKFFPIFVYNEWNAFIKERGEAFASLTHAWRVASGNAQWVTCVSGGVIYPFDVKTTDRKFRVMVGWPVGVSHRGVNLDKSVPNSLVLHQEDLVMITDERKKMFKKCEGNGDYSYATQSDFVVAKQADVKKAATSFNAVTHNGIQLVDTRPWSVEV